MQTADRHGKAQMLAQPDVPQQKNRLRIALAERLPMLPGPHRRSETRSFSSCN